MVTWEALAASYPRVVPAHAQKDARDVAGLKIEVGGRGPIEAATTSSKAGHSVGETPEGQADTAPVDRLVPVIR